MNTTNTEPPKASDEPEIARYCFQPDALRAEKTEAEKALEAASAMYSLRQFIGRNQLLAIRDAMEGEEREFFYDKMIQLAFVVASMPKTGETDGLGDKSIAHLHYFAGGRANWWITEKDCDTDGEGQVQAFGFADLFGNGDSDCAEYGYISIAEIVSMNGELDMYWKPKTIAQIKGGAA